MHSKECTMLAVMMKKLFHTGCKYAPGIVAGLRSMALPLGCWCVRRLTVGPFVLYLMESALGLVVAHYGAGGVGVVVGLVGVVLVLVLVLADLLFDLLALVLVSWARSSLYSIASALCMEVGGWTGSCWWCCWRRSSLVVAPFAVVPLVLVLVLFAPVPFVVAAFVLAGFVGSSLLVVPLVLVLALCALVLLVLVLSVLVLFVPVRGGGVCAAGVGRLSLGVVPFALVVLVLAAFVLVPFALVLLVRVCRCWWRSCRCCSRWRRSLLLSLWLIYSIE